MANITIKDIAKICGVGTSTVSRAINNDPRINAETRERVLKVVEEFHYVPNTSARNLKAFESNMVGIVVKGRNNLFFQSMYAEFEAQLKEAGYTVTLRELEWNENGAKIAKEMINEKNLQGIIFLGGMLDNIERVKGYVDIPFVLCTVSTILTHLNENVVSIDDEKESYAVVDYLIKKGHKRIAIIAGKESDYTVAAMRLKGYRRALETNGIAYDPDLVLFQNEELPDYTMENGYSIMHDAIEKKLDFTALFAISDFLAIGAYKAIYDSGKKIPEDYSVVGFDGLEITKYMYPALTTMKQPIDEMIKSSVDILKNAIDGEEECQQVCCRAELIEQDSVKDIS